jgi:hypothetical protein
MNGAKTRGVTGTLLALILVLAAGCGSSSKSSTAPNTPEQRKIDKEFATRAVLKRSDLPAGYKASPHDDDPSDDTPEPLLRKFAACAKIPKARIAEFLNSAPDPNEVEVNAPDFSISDPATKYSLTFENSVDFERSAKDVTEPLAIFTAKRALPCWRDLFQHVFASTVAKDHTSIRNVNVVTLPTGRIADETSGLGISATVVGAARAVDLHLDIYFAGSGRAVTSLLATGIGVRANPALALSLLRKVAVRLEGTS